MYPNEESLLNAGFLRQCCSEPVVLRCRDCGIDVSISTDPGVQEQAFHCRTCLSRSAPLVMCRRCGQVPDLNSIGGFRHCMSCDAFKTAGMIPFAPLDAVLWTVRLGHAGEILALTEKDLVAMILDGQVPPNSGVCKMGEEVMQPVQSHPVTASLIVTIPRVLAEIRQKIPARSPIFDVLRPLLGSAWLLKFEWVTRFRTQMLAGFIVLLGLLVVFVPFLTGVLATLGLLFSATLLGLAFVKDRRWLLLPAALLVSMVVAMWMVSPFLILCALLTFIAGLFAVAGYLPQRPRD